MDMTALVGYAASALVVLSFFVKKIIPLRLINASGCLLFIYYGVLLNEMPIILTNTIIVVVNLFFIIQHYTKKEK